MREGERRRRLAHWGLVASGFATALGCGGESDDNGLSPAGAPPLPWPNSTVLVACWGETELPAPRDTGATNGR